MPLGNWYNLLVSLNFLFNYSTSYVLGSILVSSPGLTSHADNVLICAIANFGSDLDKEIWRNLEQKLNQSLIQLLDTSTFFFFSVSGQSNESRPNKNR